MRKHVFIFGSDDGSQDFAGIRDPCIPCHFVKVWLFVFVSRWWFQIQHIFIFTPIFGEDDFEKFDGGASFSEWVGEKPPPILE